MADAPPAGAGDAVPAATHDVRPADSAALDEITAFAAALCATPLALLGVVGEEGAQILSCFGSDAAEWSGTASFCSPALASDGLSVVPDLRDDPRLPDDPLVADNAGLRFYAAAAISDAEGRRLGALCVMDHAPRAGLTPLQAQGLELLARQVAARLESDRQTRAHADSEARFRVVADSMPQMVWSTLPDGYHDYYNARWYEFTGVPPGSTDGAAWNGMFHPDDQERAWALWRHSLATGEPYEVEYRLRHHSGAYRWTLGRALPMRDADGRIVRWFGTCTDIHEQKEAMEEREMIAHELSHRIKNIFSVIAGLTVLSARERPEIADIAAQLRDRVIALGRAHDYVRPHSSQSASSLGQNSLHGVLTQLFAPYDGAAGPRVLLRGADRLIDDRSATPLALLFHELATNAAKYGALSDPDGRVTLDILGDGEECRMLWQEEGGPLVTTPGREGFGSRLMALSVERQLGGRIEREWRPEGLRVSLYIPALAMRREAEGKA